ncbi:hypothetical protein RRG08_065806 [Elysia crispata]|uniref:Secreted protein n=1 Tax=Elysia crispata TaxID=231223 RepID=A0AAE1A6G8_9GAST|nr:hypothetical protein RRG08_065806 [Elysia crispata]
MANVHGTWWRSGFLVVTLLVILYGPSTVDGYCTFPSDLAGEWVYSVKVSFQTTKLLDKSRATSSPASATSRSRAGCSTIRFTSLSE